MAMSSQIFSISLENLQNSFARMQNDAGWNTNEKMYWSYYFLDSDPNKLDTLAKKLEPEHFIRMNIRELEDDNLNLLQLEEHAVHTPESLYQQCIKLAEIVQEMDIEIFDGWDVEATKFEKAPIAG